MKIGIDISQIVYKNTGVARFTHGLVSAILENEKNEAHHWTFFFSSLRKQLDAQLKKEIQNKNYNLKTYPIPPRVLSVLWNTFHQLPSDTLTGNLDWFISSDWTQPKTSAKKLTIVHDLVFKKFPETVDPLILRTQVKRLEWVEKEADIVIADSYTTKADLLSYYPLLENKVHVIYPGVETFPIPKETQTILQKYHIKNPFFLTVGKQEPRKNILKLVEAFHMIEPNVNIQLVVVGEQGWAKEIISQDKRIMFLQKVSDHDLAALYTQALAFIYPSIYEGFGYPVVEAMRYGTPVATSNTSSLKEIGEGSALLFNPNSTTEINHALLELLNNDPLRKDLIQKGKKRSQDFSWHSYFQHLNTLLT